MKEKIFKWLYRTFEFFVPCGIALYTFLIEKLIDKDISITTKLGVSGVFVLVLMFIIAIFFMGKHFRVKQRKLEKDALKELDNEKKAKIIEKMNKNEAKQEIFHNACFFAPFLIMYFLVILIEKSMIEMRGTLFFVVLSMAIGFGFNGVSQYLHAHANEQEKKIEEKVKENIKDGE